MSKQQSGHYPGLYKNPSWTFIGYCPDGDPDMSFKTQKISKKNSEIGDEARIYVRIHIRMSADIIQDWASGSLSRSLVVPNYKLKRLQLIHLTTLKKFVLFLSISFNLVSSFLRLWLLFIYLLRLLCLLVLGPLSRLIY